MLLHYYIGQLSQSGLQIYLFSSKKIDNYLKMFLQNSAQANLRQTLNKNEFHDSRSAFRPTSFAAGHCARQEKPVLENSGLTFGNFSKQLLAQTVDKEGVRDAELWTRLQIERLFKLYDYYGPQWKIMSQQMPTRTANNLKNRFYTVLRNLIKMLFRKKADSCPKLPGEIPSKDLSRLYDGKENYKQFRMLIPSILQEINYNLESERMENVVQNYSNQIIKVYQVIYGDRAQPTEPPAQHPEPIAQLKQEQKSPLTFVQQPGQLDPEQLRVGHPNLQAKKKGEDGGKLQQKVGPGFFYLFFFNPAEFYGQQGF